MSKGPELRKAGILLFWVVMWQIADWTIDNAIVFVGPWDVARSFFALVPTKILYFRLTIIKDLSPLVGMFSKPWIGMFKNTLPVKSPQAMGVRGKMRGYPI